MELRTALIVPALTLVLLTATPVTAHAGGDHPPGLFGTPRAVPAWALPAYTHYLVRGLTLQPTGQQPGASTATGISRAFNPAVSVNALMLGAFFNGEPLPGEHEEETAGTEEEHDHAEEHEHGHGTIEEGLHLQEAEIQLTSFVDPYLKGDLIIGFHGGETEVEVACVTTQALPFGWQARVGKTYAPFGKQNLLHTHQYPFVEAPLIHQMLFGGTLAEFGGELSYLFPTPFFLQATAAVYNGDNLFFAADSPRNLSGLGRLEALWDLSENTTLELGGSAVTGKSGWSGGYEQVAGADMTLKWRPLRRSLYTQAEWQLEYLQGSRLPEEGMDRAFGGLTTHLKYRFARTWWLGTRFERTGIPDGGEEGLTRYALQFAWVPGEFELWRLQYSLTVPEHEDEPTFGALMLQMTFTIGSHPAHTY